MRRRRRKSDPEYERRAGGRGRRHGEGHDEEHGGRRPPAVQGPHAGRKRGVRGTAVGTHGGNGRADRCGPGRAARAPPGEQGVVRMAGGCRAGVLVLMSLVARRRVRGRVTVELAALEVGSVRVGPDVGGGVSQARRAQRHACHHQRRQPREARDAYDAGRPPDPGSHVSSIPSHAGCRQLCGRSRHELGSVRLPRVVRRRIRCGSRVLSGSTRSPGMPTN
jgi:hypothetical protein